MDRRHDGRSGASVRAIRAYWAGRKAPSRVRENGTSTCFGARRKLALTGYSDLGKPGSNDRIWDGRHLEVVGILLVLALTDELRVECRIAGIAHDRWPLLFGAANDSSSAVGMFELVSPGCVVARTIVFGFIFSGMAHPPLSG
jgi:hypothetical protein